MMSEADQNYLDDFLGDLQQDTELISLTKVASNKTSSFSSSSAAASGSKSKGASTANDWGISLGEFDEEIQSNADEVDTERSSNDNAANCNDDNPSHQKAQSSSRDQQQPAAAMLEEDSEDAPKPVIKTASGQNWSGVIHDSDKISSLVSNIGKDAPGKPKSTSGTYVPKSAPRVTSSSFTGSDPEAAFPSLNEALEMKPAVKQQKTPEDDQVSAQPSAAAANSAYVIKKLPAINKVTISVPPETCDKTPSPEPQQQSAAPAAGGYQLKPLKFNKLASQNPPETTATEKVQQVPPAEATYQPRAAPVQSAYKLKDFAATTKPFSRKVEEAVEQQTGGGYVPKTSSGTYASAFTRQR